MSNSKKVQIIEAATKSFANFGYKGTTMEQVAKIAKVGKGTIYTYFTNKEELLYETIGNLSKQMKKVANDFIDPTKSFISNFNELLHGFTEFHDKHELTSKLSQEVKYLGTPPVVEALKSLENEICAFIEKKIEKAIEMGELRSCNPKITAFLMFKTYTNLVNDWKERNKPLPKEEIANIINLYFMEGLKGTN